MAEPVVPRSQRFTKAARAERDRLARRRSQLFKKREDLQGRIDALDEELEAVDQEISGLEAFALTSKESHGLAEVEASVESHPNLLSGAAIRALAVPLLIREQGSAPIHYRDWLGLLNREGYVVSGKRPDAVFLNQVARSPLVRSTTRAGYYEIDLNVVGQLREKLRQQQSKLARLMGDIPTDLKDFDEHRARQRELSTAIARTERELDEAMSATEELPTSDASEAQAA